jgi:hypothetical protein
MAMILLPIVNSTRKTMRTISSSVWHLTSQIHTTSNCQSPIKKPEKKIKQKKVAALCRIMESEEHKAIQKELGLDAPLDIFVSHILAMDILVPKVALKTNVSVVRGNLNLIKRSDLPKNLDPELKVGRFSVRDNEIILENWSHLKNQTSKQLQLDEKDTITAIFEDTNKDQRLKKNIVGYFLSQGLQDARLATEVFQRARILLSTRKRNFTPEEDKIILDFVEKEGKKWAALTKLLKIAGRNSAQNRYNVLTNNYKTGPYTAEEDKIILSEMFIVNKFGRSDGNNLTVEDWKRIGGKLGRNPLYVHMHWRNFLEPILTRYQAGTLDVDVKKALLNHLVEHNMVYTQDVDWKELAQLPKFVGTTPAYLAQKFDSMKTSTREMSPELSPVELTVGAIQSWYNNSERKGTQKKEEYQEELVAYYTEIMSQERGKDA